MKTYVLQSGKTTVDTAVREKPSPGIGRVDLLLLLAVTALITLGTLTVFSAGYPYAESRYGDPTYYVRRQLIFVAIGGVLMLMTSLVPYRFYHKIAPGFYAFSMLLLVIVLFTGFSEGVAKRWLGVPGTSLSFQPSEVMKLALIMMLARYAESCGDAMTERENAKNYVWRGVVLPGFLLFGACALVLLEKHLSGTLILAAIALLVLFLAGTHLGWMSVIYGGLCAVGAAVFLFFNDYAMKRIESFLDPNADLLSDKWQTTQGLYAIGSGGLFGVGFGNSLQKYSYVSQPQNDFIFTVWCEEMGFIGAFFLIALFLLLIYRGCVVAMHAPDRFSSLLAFGITGQIGIQAFLNIAVVTDLVPNTGISLPFFSYGGSSLVILMMEMGVLLSISRKAELGR